MGEVADRIKQRMDELGVSAYRLARAVGVSDQAVSNWLNRPDGRPGRDVAPKVAEVLGVSLGWLVTGKDPEPFHARLASRYATEPASDQEPATKADIARLEAELHAIRALLEDLASR